MENLMYDIQPQALTTEELIRLAESWLDTGDSLPVAAQRELIKRIEKLLDQRSSK